MVQPLGEHQHQLRRQDQRAGTEDAHPQHVLPVSRILLSGSASASVKLNGSLRLPLAASSASRRNSRRTRMARYSRAARRAPPARPHRTASAHPLACASSAVAHQRGRASPPRSKLTMTMPAGNARQHLARIVRGPDRSAHGEDPRPQHPRCRSPTSTVSTSPPAAREAKGHAADEQRKSRLQGNHEAARGRARGRGSPMAETQHVGEGRARPIPAPRRD